MSTSPPSEIDPDQASSGDLDEEEPVMAFRRPAREEGDLDITPMIDITFLLLIFFLVATKMAAEAQVDLPPAKKGEMVSAKKSVVITMIAVGPKKAAVFLGDNTTNEAGGGAQIQEEKVTRFVEQQFRTDGRKQGVIIKAGKGVTNGDVARIMKAVGRANVVNQLHVAVLNVS